VKKQPILILLALYLLNSAAYAASSLYVVPAITDDRILPNSSISDSYLSYNISISAARGEYEPASFVVRSDADIPYLTIEATCLSGTGAIIPAENVDVRTVKVWWQAGVGIGDITHKQMAPELLLKNDSLVRVTETDNFLKLSDSRELIISDPVGIPGIQNTPTVTEFPVQDSDSLQPISLQKDKNKQIWVTVKVPEDAVPGRYSGKIFLKNSTHTLWEISLALYVLPFELSDSKLDYSIYTMFSLQDTGTIGSHRNEVQYLAHLENLLAHGINNPLIPDAPARFAQVLQLRNQTGISNKRIFYHYVIDWMSDEQIAQVKNDALNAGAEEMYVYLIDEANLSSPENQAAIARAHNNGFKVFDAQYRDRETVIDQLDLLVSSGALDAGLAGRYHSHGHKIYSYGNPQMGQEQPETYRRNYGLRLWQNDYDGGMDFSYFFGERAKNSSAGFLSNLWNDFDGYMRDHNAVYPTVNGQIDTVQWEGFREGVDDARYLSTLLDHVAYAKSRGTDVSSVEQWISDLKGSDLSARDLDVVRAEMIDLILSLPMDPIGYFDYAGCDYMTGWSCDGDDYSLPLGIHFYESGPVGSTFIAAASANNTRESAVADLCGGYAGHGFIYPTPASLKDGVSRNIYAYAINVPSGTNPYLGNKTLLCTTTTTTTTTTITTTTTSTTTSSTTIPEVCAMPGNSVPCNVVSLSEVVDAINLWAIGTFELGDVVDLINSWADPVNYPPV
jgi:hypothetical protein